jgi:Raf kinase inhibitor-like YbhB/YbcL family protein
VPRCRSGVAGLAATTALVFQLVSPAISNGGTMPVRYTCDGRGLSPPLRWTAPPAGTRSLALLVRDPDAPGGTFVHWRATGIAPRAGSISTGRHFRHESENGAGTRGWTPPCPPPGPAHRYVFVLSAVGAGGKVIARAELLVRYKRR